MQKLLQSVAAIFRPPFDGLPLVVWLYFVWCFLVVPHSPYLAGQFLDPDNYMYLAHILDWLKGQSWFDITQYRLNPPDGVPMHFSRLTELPVAGLILLFRQFGIEWVTAALAAALIWPAVLFAGLLAALCKLAKSFLPQDWIGATAYVALFAVSLTFKFSLGEVDHHNFAMLSTLLALIGVIRMQEKPNEAKGALAAGFFAALCLALALETLPFVLILMGWTGLWMILKGRVAAQSGLLSGLVFYLSSAAFLIILRPSGTWFEADPLMYSSVYVLLAGSIATCFSGVALASQTRFFSARAIAAILLGGIAVFFFFRLFPEFIFGPYGAMNHDLAQIMLKNISEAQPLVLGRFDTALSTIGFFVLLAEFVACAYLFMRSNNGLAGIWLLSLSALLIGISLFLHYVSLPFIAIATCLYFILNPSGKDPRPWILLLILLSTAMLLAGFYQVRFSCYMHLFSLVPVVEFLRRALLWVRTNLRGRKLFAAEIFLILLAGPLPMVILPSVVDGRSFNKGILLFPTNLKAEASCDFSPLKDFLNGPRFRNKPPQVIMNMADDGPKILFYTNHKILSANYHMNVDGNLSGFSFFRTTDPHEAKKVALARKADMVVVCRYLPDVYKSKKGPMTFTEQLARGNAPDWLARTGLAPSDDYKVYYVKK